MKIYVLLLCFGILVSGCGQQPEGPQPLVVGMELAYPPFEMTDEKGDPSGVSVDMAKALAGNLERPLEIRNMSFDGLIPALKTGSIDLIISSMTATEERAKSIDFSDPYLHTELSLLTSKGSGVETVADLNHAGRVVVVKLGTTGDVYAKAHLDKATLRVLDKENACVMEVVQGKADAFLFDQLSVYQNAKRHPDTTEAKLASFQRESWAIGIRQGEDELKAQVNEFLEDFRNEGGFEKLGETYLGEFQKGFRELGIPFVFDPPAAGK
ncbi:transporter substrate-binding domain-containing protein [Kiritimatiellaeota bacterium B1221]|nr:transporter substrate-binding domain-containing protein [Kiritimatiellaeota bacterium B1221]